MVWSWSLVPLAVLVTAAGVARVTHHLRTEAAALRAVAEDLNRLRDDARALGRSGSGR
jgi:hypothetical protein